MISRLVIPKFLVLFLVFNFIQFSDNESPTTTTTRSPATTRDNFDPRYAVQNVIMNRHDFNYTINPSHAICGDKSNYIFLLIYVHTTPKNFKRRLSIRETWARRSMFRDVRIVFMMGKTEEKQTKNLIELEQNTYNDIVQENFLDSYKNLTYKGIMAMKWISEYCPQAKFILKVDDDIITNTFIILRHLKSIDTHNVVKKKTVMCLVWNRMHVQREKKNKWFLSQDDFAKDSFSPYCSGSAYIFTGDLPKIMYDTSWYIKFLWVDDYFITGILAEAVNATLVSFNSLYIVNSGLVESRFQSKTTSYKTVFGHIPNAINKMYKLWKFAFEMQLEKFPSMKSNLLRNKDFVYIPEFHWSDYIWKPFLNDEVFKSNKSIFEYDSY